MASAAGVAQKFIKSETFKSSERSLGTSMIRFGVAGLAITGPIPDPLPLIDEIAFASMIVVGSALVAHGMQSTDIPSPLSSAQSAEKFYGPLPTATDTRGHVKKQIRSTSHKYSRRNNYYYKRKRNNRY